MGWGWGAIKEDTKWWAWAAEQMAFTGMLEEEERWVPVKESTLGFRSLKSERSTDGHEEMLSRRLTFPSGTNKRGRQG